VVILHANTPIGDMMKKKLLLVFFTTSLCIQQTYSMEQPDFLQKTKEAISSFVGDPLGRKKAAREFILTKFDNYTKQYTVTDAAENTIDYILKNLNALNIDPIIFTNIIIDLLMEKDILTTQAKLALVKALLNDLPENVTPQQQEILIFFKDLLQKIVIVGPRLQQYMALNKDNLNKFWDGAVAYPAVVQFFLEQGANPYAQIMSKTLPRKQVVPFIRALEVGSGKSAELLIAKMTPEQREKAVGIIIFYLPNIINKIQDNGYTLLNIIPADETELKNTLIRAGAKTASQIKGRSPLK